MSRSIKTGPCNHKLYSAVIEILNENTGIIWGFVQPRRKVAYVTSEKIKIKFGTGKNVDHVIKTGTAYDNWKSALRFEICHALIEYLRLQDIAEKDNLISRLSNVQFNGVSAGEQTIDLKTCREVNSYQSTFVHSNNDWIAAEVNNLEKPKILFREDYM